MKSPFQTLISSLRRVARRFQEFLVPRRMNRPVEYIASLDEVTINREGDGARTKYQEEDLALTHLPVGSEKAAMSEITELRSESLRKDAKLAAGYRHVAFEVSLGSEQIEYFARPDQWVPIGSVLRCLIREGKRGQLIVKIDEQELRLKQFERLLSAFEGWGMRIEFVPEVEVHRRPILKIREPRTEE
jgi:hypothetical protein